ncbi:hypothetical protein AT246_07540 [Bartonella henselae]|nr:hypothetical protein AT247_05910 [Bartonella henselae]OLL51417.1 hypothetical protein AT241_00075 [Bartonella henselae]OLL52454.1 hypothetical protein AT243_04590 [Bartonella henselae]OLL53546.1 hypothetical protein AT240_02685 [Bartonella henselae]OLL54666.1 hypothetical protein AT239_07350 [Bartonella henselae]
MLSLSLQSYHFKQVVLQNEIFFHEAKKPLKDNGFHRDGHTIFIHFFAVRAQLLSFFHVTFRPLNFYVKI